LYPETKRVTEALAIARFAKGSRGYAGVFFSKESFAALTTALPVRRPTILCLNAIENGRVIFDGGWAADRK